MKRTSTMPKLDKESVLRLSNINADGARLIVASYYAFQDNRKRSDMQVRHLGDRDGDDAALFMKYIADSHAEVEGTIEKLLDKYSMTSPVGRWARAQDGIGPVIAAGCLAHLNITLAPSAGHFWSFSGLNPEQVWEKGQKRPYCADMKQICFHMGECFKRLSGNPDALYPGLYKTQKRIVEERNRSGHYRERSQEYFTKSAEHKKVLEKGMLPQSNLDRQACNYAVKIFLSHLHAVMYWDHYGRAPSKPFAIQILGHTHEIKIPRLDMFPGLEEAYYGPTKIAEKYRAAKKKA
jgi:hypothetical protein